MYYKLVRRLFGEELFYSSLKLSFDCIRSFGFEKYVSGENHKIFNYSLPFLHFPFPKENYRYLALAFNKACLTPTCSS